MQNSGGFRLIRNSEVAKQIMKHYNQFDLIRRLEDIELNHQNEYRSLTIKIFDPETMSTVARRNRFLISNRRTIEQMQNSGGLPLGLIIILSLPIIVDIVSGSNIFMVRERYSF